MTVKELMEALRDQDPDMKVVFTYNYGDYSRTQVAVEVEGVEGGMVRHDGYTDMLAVTEETDDEHYDDEQLEEGLSDDEKAQHVVVLS